MKQTFVYHNCICTDNFSISFYIYFQISNRDIADYEKAQYLHYMINLLLPFLKQICHEQNQEEQIEAKILGFNLHLLSFALLH